MKEHTIKRYTADDLRAMKARGEDRSNYARLDAMPEEELEKSIADDPDWQGIPRDWYKSAEAVNPHPKVPVSIRLDGDVLDFFKGQGRGWQTRMNAVLRAYAQEKQKVDAS